MTMDEKNAMPPLLRPPSWAPPHPREFERLASACGLAVRERGSDPALDALAARAAALLGCPFGLVTLVLEDEQLYLGREGLPDEGTSREQALCAHTILQDEPFVVEDLRADARFAGLDLVRGAPFVRFYAGAPLRDPAGLPLGSLCVLGTEPRSPCLRRLDALARLAGAAGLVLEAQRVVAEAALRPPDGLAPDLALRRLDRALEPLARLVGGPGPARAASGTGMLF